MITLREQVANIKAKYPDYETSSILAYFDMIQEFVYSKDCDQMLYFTTTGKPPYLQTTAGNKEYSFPNGTYTGLEVRRTSRILVESETNASGWGYGALPYQNYEIYSVRGREYYSIPFSQTERTEADENRIWFDVELGTTTDTYYHLFWKAPPKIRTVNSELLIPSKHCLTLQAMVIELMKNEDYGKEDSFEYIMKKLAKYIWADMDKAYQGGPAVTPLKIQDRYIGSYQYIGRYR